MADTVAAATVAAVATAVAAAVVVLHVVGGVVLLCRPRRVAAVALRKNDVRAV